MKKVKKVQNFLHDIANALICIGILMMLGTFTVMCSVGFAASSDVIRVNEVEISEIDFDGIWPFTVSSGLLRCTLTNHVYATHRVTFLVDGVEYAVNGTAGLGGRHLDIGPIWMIDPTHPVPGVEVRVSLASVLLFGLGLCDD